MPDKISLHFIINPIAGKGRAVDIIPEIEKNIDREKFSIHFHISEKKRHSTRLSELACRRGADVLVAVGGDGTVNEVGSVAVNYNKILAVVPLGSGNGLANYLKIPHQINKCVEVINNFKTHKIDVGQINGKYFFNVAGLGFDAEVARAYSKAGERGFAAYFKAALLSYIPYKAKKYKIMFNNEVIARKALLITFANSGQYGYNTTIAPEAKIDDGYLDMCIMNKVPPLLLPIVAPQLFSKTINHTQFYESYKVKEAIIYRNKSTIIHVDGEPFKIHDRIIKVSILNEPLTIVCS